MAPCCNGQKQHASHRPTWAVPAKGPGDESDDVSKYPMTYCLHCFQRVIVFITFVTTMSTTVARRADAAGR
jgi:hypothetical protein